MISIKLSDFYIIDDCLTYININKLITKHSNIYIYIF